jgi:hypothetical protein
MRYVYAYRNIALPANIVSFVLCIGIWTNESLTAVSVLAWVKLFSTALLIAYIYLFKSHIVYFFMNIGISRNRFYASMFIIDMILFALLVTVTELLK